MSATLGSQCAWGHRVFPYRMRPQPKSRVAAPESAIKLISSFPRDEAIIFIWIEMKPEPSSRATLIGDVVGSRSVADRAGVHRLMNQALRDVATAAVDPPAFTVGDEFQGAFSSVGLAIDAALSLRLAVAPQIDVRFGLGWGGVAKLLDEAAGIQDGPGWWAAREAIEWTATARAPARSCAGPYLVSGRRGDGRRRRDQRRADLSGPPAWIVGRPIDTDCEGTVEEPDQEGHRGGGRHHPSAVSQRAGRDGLDLIVLASEYLRSVP